MLRRKDLNRNRSGRFDLAKIKYHYCGDGNLEIIVK